MVMDWSYFKRTITLEDKYEQTGWGKERRYMKCIWRSVYKEKLSRMRLKNEEVG